MIRNYKDSDLNQVNRILSFFNENINLDRNPFYKYFVCEKKNIVGVIVFQEIYERIELDYIIVDSDYRRCGIADKLMNYLIDYAKRITLLILL